MKTLRFISISILLVMLYFSSLNAQWTQTTGPTGGRVFCSASSGSNIFAGTWVGVYRSTNNGANWTSVNTGLTNTTIRSLLISGSNIFAGTQGGGVFKSTDNGASWAPAGNEFLIYLKY